MVQKIVGEREWVGAVLCGLHLASSVEEQQWSFKLLLVFAFAFVLCKISILHLHWCSSGNLSDFIYKCVRNYLEEQTAEERCGNE